VLLLLYALKWTNQKVTSNETGQIYPYHKIDCVLKEMQTQMSVQMFCTFANNNIFVCYEETLKNCLIS